uniref:Coiled-coil domain containing 170 n=1 Tax=Jaculus jaculus TaxID=51337 RepID=A0A8C5NX57_JACJA
SSYSASRVLGLKECADAGNRLLEVSVTREQLNHYRNLAENVRSELAASLVKFECAQSELQDLRTKILSKEVYCQELKAEMESYKENDARKSSLITSMRCRIQELEEESVVLSASQNRMEVTAHTAMRENQELMKTITELDEELKNCSKENEETMKQASENLRRHEEFRIQLCHCLGLDKKHAEPSDEDLILKLRELCKENTLMKGQIVTLEETINVHEMEAKANRETIMRLASEVKTEQTRAASCTEEKDKLNWMSGQHGLLSRYLKTTALEKGPSAGFPGTLKGVVIFLFIRERERERERERDRERETETETETENRCARAHSCLLSFQMASQLEAHISELVEQLGKESEFHQKALQRAHEAENKLETLQGQLNHLEGELVSGDVLRDNLNSEKQKYLKFLDRLSEKMKLNQMAAELGFDMHLDIVLARTEQLVRLESNAVLENKTIAHNLQRKLKTQKERLENKELHMNLLRQKIAQLQEEKQARTAVAVERDEAQATIRKLEKKVERLQKELGASRDSNTELKAKLADASELK